MTDGNSVAVRCLHYRWLLLNSTKGDNTNLRLHDNRSTHYVSKGSNVRDCESTTRKFIWFQLVVAGTCCQVVYSFGKTRQAKLIGIANYRNDKIATRKGYRHTNVDIFFL